MDASAEEAVSGSDEISPIDEGVQSTKKRGLDNQADAATPPRKKSKPVGGGTSPEKPNSKVLVESSTAQGDEANLRTKPKKDRSKSEKTHSKSSTKDSESVKGLTKINDVQNKNEGPKGRGSADTITTPTTSTSPKATVHDKKNPSKSTKTPYITPVVATVQPQSKALESIITKKPVETAKKDAGLLQRKKKNALKEKPGKGMGRGAKGSILGVV